MSRVLLAWIGRHDLNAEQQGAKGPILQSLLDADAAYDQVVLLGSNWFDELDNYCLWLEQQLKLQVRYKKTLIEVFPCPLDDPTHFDNIFKFSKQAIDQLHQLNCHVTINISPGTPAMSSVWLLLANGFYSNVVCVQTSQQNGTRRVQLPFDISLELRKHTDNNLTKLASGKTHLDKAFSDIEGKSELMKIEIARAKKIAQRDVPVIIQGPTGSGKEVIAHAIHHASSRANNLFRVINCGAIPANLVESELFGHVKGAFTGADKDKKGIFEQAHGGTLFLDELGELPLDAQVKLLRVIQQGELTPVGSSKTVQIDVRVICATHRDLLQMIESGSFREDLFYRLAVGVINLPSLQQRQDDIEGLAISLLNEINQEAASQPDYIAKRLDQQAIAFIKQHTWPGNVRELKTTLTRASIWCDDQIISPQHIEQSIIARDVNQDKASFGNIHAGFSIEQEVKKLKQHYIEQALAKTKYKKGQAAQLLGLNSHQVLTKWMQSVGIE